jgi:hypothetical protein
VVTSNQPFCSTADGGGRNSGSIKPVAVTAHQMATRATNVSKLIQRVFKLRRSGITAELFTFESGFTVAAGTS